MNGRESASAYALGSGSKCRRASTRGRSASGRDRCRPIVARARRILLVRCRPGIPDIPNFTLSLGEKTLKKECVVRSRIIEVVGRPVMESAGHKRNLKQIGRKLRKYRRFIMSLQNPAPKRSKGERPRFSTDPRAFPHAHPALSIKASARKAKQVIHSKCA